MPQNNPVTPRINRRLGLKTLRDLAYKFCQLYVRFSPAINLFFVENPPLLIALEAVNTACGVLVSEVDKVTEKGV